MTQQGILLEALNRINESIVKCQKCKLHLLEVNDNKKETLGYGKLLPRINTSTEIMVMGLNPSHNRFPGLRHPFGGGHNFKKDKNAKFLEIFKGFNVFDKCYITNIVKCSTADNDVKMETIKACSEHIDREIDYCKPKVIIAAGSQVYNFLLRLNLKNIEKIYHPSYCFSYHGVKLEDYIIQIRNILKKYKLLEDKYE